jgi:hypothetical protein
MKLHIMQSFPASHGFLLEEEEENTGKNSQKTRQSHSQPLLITEDT